MEIHSVLEPTQVEDMVIYRLNNGLLNKLSKIHLMLNLLFKNLIDGLVPYSSVNRKEEIINNENLFEMLQRISKEISDYREEFGQSIYNSNPLLFFISILNMYSLTSVAFTTEVNWLNSKIHLSSGIVPSESSWLVSVIFSSSMIGLFFLITIALYLIIKFNKTTPRLIKFAKAIMIILVSGLLVENVIFLLSNFICESTNGHLHIQNNEDIECMSPSHIALLIISVIVFIMYFFIAQVFYPSFYKLDSDVECYFNVEVHCKVLYSVIASCISNELIGFKLILCFCLILALILYSYYKIDEVEACKNKFQEDIKEYFFVLWIYFLALLYYYKVASGHEYVVLIVTIAIYSLYSCISSQKKIVELIAIFFRFNKNNQVNESGDIINNSQDESNNLIPNNSCSQQISQPYNFRNEVTVVGSTV